MFSFIHTYADGVFPALVKSGLWSDGDGLKLMHKPAFVPPYDFNTLLAEGSLLDDLLGSLGCPFYVDRLQGGVGCDRAYPYDRRIIRRLKESDKISFLGFQMHEWASNLRSDELRIRELCAAEGADADDPEQFRRIMRRVADGELGLFLEAYTAGQWSRLTLSRSLDSFLRAAEELYSRRVSETESALFPADSYYQAPRIEIAHGASLLMPECGWQVPDMRVQIASARGAAKSAGIKWGVYYECWHVTAGYGFTIPFSLRRGDDEWREDMLHKGNGADLPFDRRERGGSSLSLLARAWRLAYFSGASYLAEEYGVCNTFRELENASLSPYGEQKLSFLRFVRKFPDIGEPYVPIAVVLPSETRMLEIPFGETYLGYPAEGTGYPRSFYGAERNKITLEDIFGAAGEHGNMGHVIKSGGLPAVCDIIYPDMSEAAAGYEYLIDLTGDEKFAAAHPNAVSVGRADELLDELLPLRVGGGLLSAYNRTRDGWYVLVMNNDGIYHDAFEPDARHPEAAVRAELRLRSPGTVVTKKDGDGSLYCDGSAYSVGLAAGEWILLGVGSGDARQ